MKLLLGVDIAAQTRSIDQLMGEVNVIARTSLYTRVVGIAEYMQDHLKGSGDLSMGAYVDVGLAPIIRSNWLDMNLDHASGPLSFLRARLGAAYVNTLASDVKIDELRLVADLTPRQQLPWSILLEWRNRNEFRWINGHFSYRYRSRLWLERSFDIAESMMLTPMLSYEVYYDGRDAAFVRGSVEGGLALAVNAWLAFELKYLFQRDWYEESVNVHAVKGTASFYF
jgi:hypothetical protein